MPYVTQMRIGDNRTVFLEGGSKKCEREFTMSFAPGELRADDAASISKYAREMGELVRLSIAEGLQGAQPEVRVPPVSAATKPTQASPAVPAAAPSKTPPTRDDEDDGAPATERQLNALRAIRKNVPGIVNSLLKESGVEQLEQLTAHKASVMIGECNKAQAALQQQKGGKA